MIAPDVHHDRVVGVGVKSAHSQLYSRKLPPKSQEIKYFSVKYYVKLGHFLRFL